MISKDLNNVYRIIKEQLKNYAIVILHRYSVLFKTLMISIIITTIDGRYKTALL